MVVSAVTASSSGNGNDRCVVRRMIPIESKVTGENLQFLARHEGDDDLVVPEGGRGREASLIRQPVFRTVNWILRSL